MKSNEQKMARMDDILNLPVQDPPCAEFSAALLNWAKVEGGRQGGDDIALIPFSRVEDFVKGESSLSECPASFRVESRRRRSQGSVSKPRVDGYLEYTLYWCSYGPEDYRDNEQDIGDNANHKPASGKGSRPGRRHMMRGCLCHFTVKRLYTRPLLALIIYNQRNHVDKTGAPCHGVLDRDAVGTRAMYAPRISEELRQKVMSMLYVGISLDDIIQHHSAEVDRQGGPSSRDDFLSRNDVHNMERLIRQSGYQLHADDMCSVRLWVQRHQRNVFFFQDTSAADFVLGIQTDWQLQQLLRYGHNSFVAFHSSFGPRKLRYPLSTLLVFDSNQNAIPVAWIITSGSDGQYTRMWMGSLVEKTRTKEPGWRPQAFLIDDPAFEINVIRDAFRCRVLLCLWYIRRAWARNLMRNCCNFDLQLEMFKHLGRILYYAKSEPSTLEATVEFSEIFIDQSTFMDYFQDEWLPRIETWVHAMRTLPVANLEFNTAFESYHLRLKSKLFDEIHAGSWPRVDWLIHTLTTEFHALYWFDFYSEETGYFNNMRGGISNSWRRALLTPDIDVIFDDQELRFVKVVSQSNRSLVHTVWNPGSEFSLCDCSWSRLGNLCKHVTKVGILCRIRQLARPSFAAQMYHQTLLNLLQNPPDDPVILDHAILHATRLQQDIKGLEDLSNSGFLQGLTSVHTGVQVTDGLMNLPHFS